MLPGFSGRLLTEFLLEDRLDQSPLDRRRRGQFIDWRRRCLTFGPAASLRALMELGAEPFLLALGFDSVVALVALPSALAATGRSASGSITLVVAPWAERLDAFWRPGVVEARRRGTQFLMLFNGTHARLI